MHVTAFGRQCAVCNTLHIVVATGDDVGTVPELLRMRKIASARGSSPGAATRNIGRALEIANLGVKVNREDIGSRRFPIRLRCFRGKRTAIELVLDSRENPSTNVPRNRDGSQYSRLATFTSVSASLLNCKLAAWKKKNGVRNCRFHEEAPALP